MRLFNRDSPKPTKQARENKEQLWFQSIRGRKVEATSSEPAQTNSANAGLWVQQQDNTGIGQAPRARGKRPALAQGEGRAETPVRNGHFINREATPSTSIIVTSAPDQAQTMGGYDFVEPSDSPTAKGTRTLAMQLKELSIAHTDGLIASDEYRVLRQAVFEKHSKQSADERQAGSENGKQPTTSEHFDDDGQRKPSLQGSALQPRSNSQNLPTFNTKHRERPKAKASTMSVYSDAASTKTSRSFASTIMRKLPTRSSKNEQDDWDALHQKHKSRETAPDSDQTEDLKLPSGNTFRQSLLPPLPLSSGDKLSPDLSMRRGSSSASTMSASSDGQSQVGSYRFSIASRPSMRGVQAAYTSHSFETAPDHYSSASSGELQQEIEQLEAERDRMLAAFTNLMENAKGKHRGQDSTSVLSPTTTPVLSHKEKSSRSHTTSPSTSSHSTRDSPITPKSISQRLKSSRLSVMSKTSDASLSPITNFPRPPSQRSDCIDSDLTFDSPRDNGAHSVKIGQLADKMLNVQTTYDERVAYLQVKLQGARLREKLSR